MNEPPRAIHENGETMAYVGVRVEPPVRLVRVAAAFIVR